MNVMVSSQIPGEEAWGEAMGLVDLGGSLFHSMGSGIGGSDCPQARSGIYTERWQSLAVCCCHMLAARHRK